MSSRPSSRKASVLVVARDGAPVSGGPRRRRACAVAAKAVAAGPRSTAPPPPRAPRLRTLPRSPADATSAGASATSAASVHHRKDDTEQRRVVRRSIVPDATDGLGRPGAAGSRGARRAPDPRETWVLVAATRRCACAGGPVVAAAPTPWTPRPGPRGRGRPVSWLTGARFRRCISDDDGKDGTCRWRSSSPMQAARGRT